MKKLTKWMLAVILTCGTTTLLTSCSSNNDNPVNPDSEKIKATDYSNKANWLQMPEITKDVDVFYIYGTSTLTIVSKKVRLIMHRSTTRR